MNDARNCESERITWISSDLAPAEKLLTQQQQYSTKLIHTSISSRGPCRKYCQRNRQTRVRTQSKTKLRDRQRWGRWLLICRSQIVGWWLKNRWALRFRTCLSGLRYDLLSERVRLVLTTVSKGSFHLLKEAKDKPCVDQYFELRILKMIRLKRSSESDRERQISRTIASGSGSRIEPWVSFVFD